nr:DNA methyltransferase [uncultured Flavobacterium sp.]
MADASLDIICIDPPYLYLKGQKLERPFDERLFFSECYRLLKKGGFIVMFGRGTSFYRWNTILEESGFDFKEEIVWNKSQCSSPLMALSRVHETVSIHCKGKGKINKVKVPYLEMKGHDIDAVVQDIKRMKSVFNNTKSFDAVSAYLEHNRRDDRVYCDTFTKHNTTSDKRKSGDRAANAIQSIVKGMNEKSIIRYRDTSDNWQANNISISSDITKEDRSVSVIRSFDDGMNEKSIIKQVRDHYSSIHPTQKPVRLLERLLALVLPKSKEKVVVADFFMGSGSTGEACFEISKANNIDVHFIGCEIDNEYFEGGKNRLEKLGYE